MAHIGVVQWERYRHMGYYPVDIHFSIVELFFYEQKNTESHVLYDPDIHVSLVKSSLAKSFQ